MQVAKFDNVFFLTNKLGEQIKAKVLPLLKRNCSLKAMRLHVFVDKTGLVTVLFIM